MKILKLSLVGAFLLTACGNQEHLPSFALEGDKVMSLASSTEATSSSGTKSYQTAELNIKGSICIWDYGAGIGGIYTTLAEFQARVQSKVNSGQITHCVSINGNMLPLKSPNGLFGPCMGGISQGNASLASWSSCASTIQ